MFNTQCFAKRVLRLRMFSSLLAQKNVNDFLTSMVFYHLPKNSPHQCYCVKSDDIVVTDSEPSSLISERYELQEYFDDSSITADYVKFTKFHERCIAKIKRTLKCSQREATALYREYPSLFYENIRDSLKKVALFTDAGISESSILKNVDILELDHDEIVFKIEQLNMWGLNEEQKSNVLAFLNLPPNLFKKVSLRFIAERDQIPTGNRLIHFANVLNCTLEEMVNLSIKYHHLLTRNFEEMEQIFKLLFRHEITPQTLRKHLWLTNVPMRTIKKWLAFSQVQKSSCSAFDKYISNYLHKMKEKEKIEKRMLKQNQTKAEFLSKKLQIDVKIINYLMLRYPRIFNRDLSQLTEVIDFLYSHGYTGIQICTNPSILNKDIAFIQKRLDECQLIGYGKLALSVLSIQESKYKRYLKEFTLD